MGFLAFILTILICYTLYRAIYQPVDDNYPYPKPKKDQGKDNLAKAIAESNMIEALPETKEYRQELKNIINKQLYHPYIMSQEWSKKAEARKKLDHYICQMCLSKNHLVVHHLHYQTLTYENINTDLITLCRTCHSELHASMSLKDMEDHIQMFRLHKNK